MWIVSMLVLLALGALGVLSWLRVAKPALAVKLAPVEAFGGWIGAFGVLWGVWLLIGFLRALSVIAHAPLTVILAGVAAVAVTALSLILAMPVLKAFIPAGPAAGIGKLADRLAPFKVILGAICIGLAAWTLVGALR